jgi:hypothetical protein
MRVTLAQIIICSCVTYAVGVVTAAVLVGAFFDRANRVARRYDRRRWTRP